jgi:hypothetical protein
MSDFNSNAKPVPPDTLIDDLNPSRFLKPTDLTERWHVQSLTVTISRLSYEDTWPSMQDIDPRTRKPKVKVAPVLYFNSKNGGEFPRGMLLGAGENITALKAATGARTVGEMVGKRITIIVGEFRHKPVLRISPETPPAASTPAAVRSNGNEQASKPSLADLREQLKTGDVIVAYSGITKMAGIDQPTAQAILRECLGDFETAFDKIAEQYAKVLS